MGITHYHPTTHVSFASTKSSLNDGEKRHFEMPPLDDGIKISGTDRDIITHVQLLDSSLRSLTGQGVWERMMQEEDLSTPEKTVLSDLDPTMRYEQICSNDHYVLISHGTEADPIYNFGNKAALDAFHRSWHDLIILPSAKSVVLRSEDEVLRNELFRKVANDGYVQAASGIRVRDDGRFIKLVDAVVWNCYDQANDGRYIGQAAFFDRNKCPIIETY